MTDSTRKECTLKISSPQTQWWWPFSQTLNEVTRVYIDNPKRHFSAKLRRCKEDFDQKNLQTCSTLHGESNAQESRFDSLVVIHSASHRGGRKEHTKVARWKRRKWVRDDRREDEEERNRRRRKRESWADIVLKNYVLIPNFKNFKKLLTTWLIKQFSKKEQSIKRYKGEEGKLFVYRGSI